MLVLGSVHPAAETVRRLPQGRLEGFLLLRLLLSELPAAALSIPFGSIRVIRLGVFTEAHCVLR